MLWSLVATTVWCALNWAAFRLYEHRTYGTIHTETTLSITVHRGDRFSVSVPDRGLSVGDYWRAQVTPDGSLKTADHRKVLSGLYVRLFGSDVGGGGGTTYFIYTAEQAGIARVILSNCFQGCNRPDPESRSIVWTVTVS